MGLTSGVKNLSQATVICFLGLHVDWLRKKTKKWGEGHIALSVGHREKPRVLTLQASKKCLDLQILKPNSNPFNLVGATKQIFWGFFVCFLVCFFWFWFFFVFQENDEKCRQGICIHHNSTLS